MRFILRRDSLEKWNTNNPILMNAEVAIVEEDGFKSLVIGDGEHRFQELPRVKLQKGVSVMMGLYPNGKFRFHAIEDNLEKEEEKEVMGENYIVINGKKAELTEEQLKTLGIVTKKNPFERVAKTEPYYYIDAFDCIQTCADNREDVDNLSFEANNYFNDKVMAQQVRFHQLLYRKLLKFAWDNGYEDMQEWNDENKHWRFYYDVDNKCFSVCSSTSYKHSGAYFSSKEGVERAIEEVIKPFMAEYPEFVW